MEVRVSVTVIVVVLKESVDISPDMVVQTE